MRADVLASPPALCEAQATRAYVSFVVVFLNLKLF